MLQPLVSAQPSGASTVGDAASVVAHNLRITAELSRILEALERASLPCMVLKGIPLVHRIGEGLSARRVADNDLLLRRADLARAVRVLEPLGYESAKLRNLEYDLQDNFEHPLIRVDSDGSLLVCELHWNAFPPSLFSVPETLLWERSLDVEVAGVRAKVFEPALQLLHLVSHALQHELSEPRTLGTFGLAWNRWHREVSRDDLERLAQSLGMEYAFEYVLTVTRHLRLTEGPGAAHRTRRVGTVLRLMDSKRLLVNAEDTFPERYFRLLAALLLVPRRRAIGHLLARAFPKPDWAARQRGPRAIAEHYLARPLRPVLRSVGWRPTGRTLEVGLDSGLKQATAAVAYLGIHRRLAVRYKEIPLDELLSELEAGRESSEALTLDELALAIRAAERLAPRLSPTPNTCLYRALTRFALLRMHAHDASFILGVGQPVGEPGHAWVEIAGKPFMEPRAPSFARILTRESRRV